MNVDVDKDARWWKLENEDPYKAVERVVGMIRQRQNERREMDLRHARLYGNLPLIGVGTQAITRPSTLGGPRLALNVVKNMTGAVVAKIAKNKPKPTFLTSAGDYDQQKRAKQLEKFIEGQFYEAQLYDLGPDIFRDACIFGTGVLKIYATEGDIEVERVFPWEIIVDDGEAQYGTPRCLYQRKYVDRLVLAELYPEQADKIKDASCDTEDYEIGRDVTADQVLVTEAWHLPSGPKAKDGRHVIAIENATLLDEKYTDSYFPFVFLRWSKAPAGFWGVGLAEELTGIQLEINKLLREIQQAHHLLGKAHWMVDNASKIISAHLDNDVGSIIRYSGGLAPQVYTPQAVSADVYQHLWNLYEKAYEITGISPLSAQSQKPAGLNSGKAMQVYDDIETERFMIVGREYEKFFMDAAKQIIDRARDLAKGSGFTVKARAKQFIEKIDWKDVDLKEDEYAMQVFPTSALADEPAQRMAQVQELANAGWIDPGDAKRLLDFPDLQQESNFANASYDLTMEMIQKMIDKGEYMSPEPFMNLEDSIKRTQLAYLRAKLDGVPEERLELLRRFMMDANDILNPPPPPVDPNAPQPMPPGPPGMPPGPPMDPSMMPPPGMPDPAVMPPMAA